MELNILSALKSWPEFGPRTESLLKVRVSLTFSRLPTAESLLSSGWKLIFRTSASNQEATSQITAPLTLTASAYLFPQFRTLYFPLLIACGVSGVYHAYHSETKYKKKHVEAAHHPASSTLLTAFWARELMAANTLFSPNRWFNTQTHPCCYYGHQVCWVPTHNEGRRQCTHIKHAHAYICINFKQFIAKKSRFVEVEAANMQTHTYSQWIGR